MKIIGLKAENIKNLKAVEIKPEGGAVILTGRNGAGKSSILDAIFMGLTGKKVAEPIRNGTERGEITVTLDRITVKRVYTRKGVRLEVWNNEGARFASPQTLLDEIVGGLSFDPMAFKLMPEKAQARLLTDLAGLNIDEAEARRAELYTQRTFENKEANSLKGALMHMDTPASDVPDTEIPILPLLEEVKKIEGAREKFDAAASQFELLKEDQQDQAALILEIKAKIEQLKRDLREESTSYARLSERVKEFKHPEQVTAQDVEVKRARVTEAEQTNIRVRAARDYRLRVAAIQDKQTKVNQLTDEIKAIDESKASALANAAFPVEGLSVDGAAVFFEGVPFTQRSTGEQIRISTAIAMALNPKLRVILIRDGSLLDQGAMREVLKAAGDRGYQVWVEKLDESGKVGVYIEDGEIMAVDGVSPQTKKEEVLTA